VNRILGALALTALQLAACGKGSDDSAMPAAADQGDEACLCGSTTAESNMVEWLQPAVSDLHIRSEEEKQQGMEQGRGLPEPEILQPRLDSALAPFEPRLAANVRGSFVGGASDILPGLVTQWIDAFRKFYPNVTIELAKPYAGSLGMLKVIEGNYDFVFVSRELKPTDIESFAKKYGYPPLSVPISGASYRHYGFLDAVGFFVNVGNPLDKLSFDQIDALYSSTRNRGGSEIRTWGDLGLTGKWADKPVHVYGFEPWNGFEEFVRQRVLNFDGKRGEWRDDIRFSDDAFPIATQVANDPLGIGYTGLAYLNRGVKVLALAAKKGSTDYVPASYERVADASYPLSRLIYFNGNAVPGEGLDPVLGEFVRFILSRNGQEIVLEQSIFLPLRNSQVVKGLALLSSAN
jgi:ABC-type phosphate transport system substrate-binding protein